jgi:hypothetical protein
LRIFRFVLLLVLVLLIVGIGLVVYSIACVQRSLSPPIDVLDDKSSIGGIRSLQS